MSPHILVVNHEPEIIALMRDVLEPEAFRVTDCQAHDTDAIAAAEPDLVILDATWPLPADEPTLLDRLAADHRTRHIPLVLCTAAVHHVRAVESHLDSIGVRVVYMPFDIGHLLDVIREAVGGEAAPGDRTVQPPP